MQDADDNERIERWRNGDENGFIELVEQYRRPLFSFILRMTGGHDDADDIFQEVWFRAIRNIDRYRHRHFVSWLFRIAHNLIIDRSRRRKPSVPLDDDQGGRTAFEVAGSGPSPSDSMHNQELQSRIHKAVESLPPDQREVFLMRMDAELPFKEIARIQKVSINTALARMSYALDKLKTLLAQDYQLIIQR